MATSSPSGCPSADNTLVTHRVTKVADNGNSFTTKGDANDTVDPFTTKSKDILGQKWFVVPKVGRLMVFLASGLGTALLILIPGGIYLGQTLADRRAARRAAEAADAGPQRPPSPRTPRPDDADAPPATWPRTEADRFPQPRRRLPPSHR